MPRPPEHPPAPGAYPARAYLGLGSNLGDSKALLLRAVGKLGELPGTRVVALSDLYVTAPVGGPEQPDFLNMVVAVDTTMPPLRLLRAVQGLEDRAGRKREERWGPRTLDVDILWYHAFEATEGPLQVPHPRMEERRFVLEPLAEIAPDLVLRSGRTVREALACVREQVVTRLLGENVFRDEDSPDDPAKE